MIAARESGSRIVITKPYLSNATHKLAISAVQHVVDEEGMEQGHLIVNFNLQRLVSYLSGNELSRNIYPWFKLYYGTVSTMLIVIAVLLISAAGVSLYQLLFSEKDMVTGSFGIVVLVTLGMSIFDLGKTILEEEVLFDKSMGHRETTRRTINRFMTAIIIAVSIEALLLMFKSLFSGNDTSQLVDAVWMILASVGMFVGLGIYTFLSNERQD